MNMNVNRIWITPYQPQTNPLPLTKMFNSDNMITNANEMADALTRLNLGPESVHSASIPFDQNVLAVLPRYKPYLKMVGASPAAMKSYGWLMFRYHPHDFDQTPMYSQELATFREACFQRAKECAEYPTYAHYDNELEDVFTGIYTRPVKDYHTVVAVRLGLMGRLYELRAAGCEMDEYSIRMAAFAGDLPMVRYLVEQKCDWSEQVARCAVVGGHLEVLRYLWNVHCPWMDSLTRNAAYNGKLDCLKFLVETCRCKLKETYMSGGMEIHIMTATAAAENGQADCLRYLMSLNCPVDGKTFAAVVQHKMDPDILSYCLANTKQDSEKACTMAAAIGNLELLKQLREKGVPINEEQACKEAAFYGHLEVMKWIGDSFQSVWWFDGITTAAALGGRLDCLKYAVDKNCPVTLNVNGYVRSDLSPEIIAYLEERIQAGHPVSLPQPPAYAMRIGYGGR